MTEETLSDGADPWCTWCDVDVTAGPIWLIEGIDNRRWPPTFCSEQCASRWGNATMQDRIYRADDGLRNRLLNWTEENTELETVLSDSGGEAH